MLLPGAASAATTSAVLKIDTLTVDILTDFEMLVRSCVQSFFYGISRAAGEGSEAQSFQTCSTGEGGSDRI